MDKQLFGGYTSVSRHGNLDGLTGNDPGMRVGAIKIGSGTKRLHFWLLLLLVCLLFTVTLWDHYFNSDRPLDRRLASNLILIMGTLFSVAASLFAWSLEKGLSYVEGEVDKRTRELKQQNGELAKAMSEIKVLRGFIPVCASCKKIRNEQGYWEQLESYLEQHSEAQFSHGLCQGCIKQLYPKYHKEAKPA
ncbi:MAG: hypothetical protein Q8R76_09105 [Candidatus Omnitrophota bacterium]|nr:hypothetical protein [Candidatus Omnitrophota bacterium]